jgi:chromosome segregation ATPase
LVEGAESTVLQDLQKELRLKFDENNMLRDSLDHSEASLQNALLDIESLKERHDRDILERERDFQQKKREAERVLADWETCCHGLETHITKLEADMKSLEKQRDTLSIALQVAEYKLVAEKAANDALFSKYDASENHLMEASQNLIRQRESLFEELGSLKSQLKLLEEDRKKAKNDAIGLQKELADLTNETEDIITQWKGTFCEVDDTPN